jgi:flagellar hook-basal body complex protein FliE
LRPAAARVGPSNPSNGGLFDPSSTAARTYSADIRHDARRHASERSPMNDLRIKPFDFQAAVARAGLRPDGMPRTDGPTATGGSFRTAMASALQDVSRSQFEAQRLQRELSLDNPAVSLEQTMLAMNKAQLGFQATLQVRNRLLQAYSEVMNMQV